MSFFFGRGRRDKPVFNRNAIFRLTGSGQAEVARLSGDPKSHILVVLESGGSANVDEIVARSHLSRGQVERLLPAMVRGNLIQPVTGLEEQGL